jgi:hypothetical protein
MILAIGTAADPTFLHLLARLRARAHVLAVDVVQLALTGRMRLDPDDLAASCVGVGRTRVRLADVDGVWVRLPDVRDGAPDERGRDLVAGVQRALACALHALDVPVVNPPLVEPSNFSKPAHLVSLAALVGLPVPESCLTGSPERAAAFVEEHHGDVISKGVSATKTWVRRWDPVVDPARLALIRSTPVLLQRAVRGPDVRVHVACGELVAERIDCPEVDYRVRGAAPTFSAVRCPPAVEAACRALSVHLGAPLLGVDLKIDESTGEWVLLEANVLPCFQGYDRRAHGAISAAVVAHLTSGEARTARDDPGRPGPHRAARPVGASRMR